MLCYCTCTLPLMGIPSSAGSSNLESRQQHAETIPEHFRRGSGPTSRHLAAAAVFFARWLHSSGGPGPATAKMAEKSVNKRKKSVLRQVSGRIRRIHRALAVSRAWPAPPPIPGVGGLHVIDLPRPARRSWTPRGRRPIVRPGAPRYFSVYESGVSVIPGARFAVSQETGFFWFFVLRLVVFFSGRGCAVSRMAMGGWVDLEFSSGF